MDIVFPQENWRWNICLLLKRMSHQQTPLIDFGTFISQRAGTRLASLRPNLPQIKHSPCLGEGFEIVDTSQSLTSGMKVTFHSEPGNWAADDLLMRVSMG